MNDQKIVTVCIFYSHRGCGHLNDFLMNPQKFSHQLKHPTKNQTQNLKNQTKRKRFQFVKQLSIVEEKNCCPNGGFSDHVQTAISML